MNAVLHLSSGDEDDGAHALANASNLLADETVEIAEVVLVANGDAVFLLVEGSPVASEVADLHERGATVRACRNSLGTRDLSPDDLLPGVETVPSGVGELVRLQDAGHHYVKTP